MWSRTSRRLLSCAVATVAGLSAGWWQWSHDDAPSDEERIAALDGVATAEYDPAHPYEITLDPGLSTDQISGVLTATSSILESTDDPSAYPMLFALTETAEYYVDLGADIDQAAALIATTEAADLAGADVDFDEDSLSQLTFPTESDVLAGAQQLLADLDRAGVTDLEQIGGQIELSYVGRSRDGYGPLIQLIAPRTDAAIRKLGLLAQTLQRSGADLTQADLGSGDQVIEVAVPGQAQVEPTARVFTAAYGESHLDLTIDSEPSDLR